MYLLDLVTRFSRSLHIKHAAHVLHHLHALVHGHIVLLIRFGTYQNNHSMWTSTLLELIEPVVQFFERFPVI